MKPDHTDQERLELLAERRARIQILCHRGAVELFHENTLEAYRASLQLGADGNEIDIRSTRDGVLVCFHDDMLDHLLWAYGEVETVTWPELRSYPFRNPGRLGSACRVPTLEEVLQLHRQYAGLLHLDIKRPNLDERIIELLDRFDMWNHVLHCNGDNGGKILTHPRLRLGRYKGSLYQDKSEVFPEAIRAVLDRPGDSLIVDDPRGAIRALGRKVGSVTRIPIDGRIKAAPKPRSEPSLHDDDPRSSDPSELLRGLDDNSDWNRVAESDDEQRVSGARITRRARFADAVLRHRAVTKEITAALIDRVRHRSLHRHWMFHGLDGASALRTLLELRLPGAVDTARETLWRDDPALEPVVNPAFKNPRAWTDFRIKMVVFPALAYVSGFPSESLCRDYLALSDPDAAKLGPQLFDDAARTMIAISPNASTVRELLGHRSQTVRGRSILECLSLSNQPWARNLLESQAPFALEYLVPWTDIEA